MISATKSLFHRIFRPFPADPRAELNSPPIEPPPIHLGHDQDVLETLILDHFTKNPDLWHVQKLQDGSIHATCRDKGFGVVLDRHGRCGISHLPLSPGFALEWSRAVRALAEKRERQDREQKAREVLNFVNSRFR